ncbi:MAG: Hsp20/alpha crystallin family protein [Deltaproteobacteria bacterium]
MALVRWKDPIGELSSIQERMNRLFGEAFGPTLASEEGWSRGWEPAVDIYDADDAIVVKAEIPGVERDQVSVEVKDGVLTLKGERKFERDVKEENYHRIERSYGSFQRSFTLPSSVDPDKVRASLKNGVLEVTLTKKEQARPKQIRISA